MTLDIVTESVHAWMTRDGRRPTADALERYWRDPDDRKAELVSAHLSGIFVLPNLARHNVTIAEVEAFVGDACRTWQLDARRRAIIETREQLGLNQASFARAIGVDQSTVSRFENGTTTPNKTAVKLCRHLLRRGESTAKVYEKLRLAHMYAEHRDYVSAALELRDIQSRCMYTVGSSPTDPPLESDALYDFAGECMLALRKMQRQSW